MKKTIHNILKATLIATCAVVSAPAMAEAPTQFAAEMAADVTPVEITVSNGSTLRVKNAEGSVVEVFSITGRKEMSQRVESQSASFDLGHLPKGVYLVKVGKTTVKIYLR